MTSNQIPDPERSRDKVVDGYSADAAVINLAEGGLSTWDQSYFDLGKNDIGSGDLVVLQLGHNEARASIREPY